MSNIIQVGDLQFQMTSGNPAPYWGRRSGRELAGFELEFDVEGWQAVRQIKELLAQEQAPVRDPFTGRDYEGSISLISSMSIDGRPDHVHLSVRELDIPLLSNSSRLMDKHNR